MHSTDALAKQKLIRLSDQLSLTEQHLHTHPLTQDQFSAIQTTLHFLHLHLRWKSAGPLSRLLMTAQTALLGCQTSQSATGFIGPTLSKLQSGTFQLMRACLKPSNNDIDDLLFFVNQLIHLGFIYIATEVLKNEKTHPEQDPDAARRAELLKRELSLIFLFGSGMIKGTYQMAAKGLGVDEQGQEWISDIGLVETLITLVALADVENKEKEWLDSLYPFLSQPLDSMEHAIERLFDQGKIEEETFFTGKTQVQLLRLSLSQQEETEGCHQAIERSFEALEIPYEEVKKDLNHLITFFHQLKTSFKNIFEESKTAITTMNQSA